MKISILILIYYNPQKTISIIYYYHVKNNTTNFCLLKTRTTANTSQKVAKYCKITFQTFVVRVAKQIVNLLCRFFFFFKNFIRSIIYISYGVVEFCTGTKFCAILDSIFSKICFPLSSLPVVTLLRGIPNCNHYYFFFKFIFYR